MKRLPALAILLYNRKLVNNMGKGCRKGNDNVYFLARKNAAECNDRLSSRESAAEQLGVSVSTLADYELGATKVVPVDKVVLMADLYGCPELKNMYCKHECPIGKDMAIATEPKRIDGVVLNIVHEFDADRVDSFRKNLVEIANDGEVTDDEKKMLWTMIGLANDMEFALSQLRMEAERILR